MDRGSRACGRPADRRRPRANRLPAPDPAGRAALALRARHAGRQSALGTRGYTRASGLLLRINGLAADDGAVDLDVHDGVRAHLVRILLEDDEIRQLAGGDRTPERS